MGLIGFIILAVVIDCGGVGSQGYLGAKYWRTYYSRSTSPFLYIYISALLLQNGPCSKKRANEASRVNVSLSFFTVSLQVRAVFSMIYDRNSL